MSQRIETVQLNLVMPAETYRQLTKLAEHFDRSRNAQLRVMIRDTAAALLREQEREAGEGGVVA